LGKSKNAAGCISHLSESQKRRKTLVVGRRNIENTEKCSSSADETQKTQKKTCHRPTKYRKRRKTPVIGRRNAENTGKCLSSVDEIKKILKNARHPWMKPKKRRKSSVIHG